MSALKRQKIEKQNLNDVVIVSNKNDECLPIKSLKDLINWKPLMRNHVTALLQERLHLENYPKTLICHDMRGGYLEDRYINGSNTEDNYYFLHWKMIDIFVYFSHNFITIPPCSWISASHKNGVKILGTFITEWKEGIKICEELFKDETIVEELSSQLVKLAEYYNFDGWLINIENKLETYQIPLLKTFLESLSKKMHSCKQGSQIIWYDSVLETGDLKWQNALNENNKMFFNCCDGIFLNYNWTEETLQKSVDMAGERKTDIFVGVDVFGRGCPGGGGFCTDFAVTEARKFNLSVAIFAPGWIHECLDIKDFEENQFKFWNALHKFCPSRVIKNLPYFSSFCPGFGNKLFKHGKILSYEHWFNLSLQEPQPIYHSDDCSDNTRVSFYTDDAFNGGGCICLSRNAGKEDSVDLKETSNFNILKTSFTLKGDVIVSYTYKSLTPNVEVALVLHMNKLHTKTFNLSLVGKTLESGHSDASFLLPASKEEIEKQCYTIDENPSVIENWIKRLYILNSDTFKNHCIEGISITVTSLQKVASHILLGEIQILPVQYSLTFTYRNLQCHYVTEKAVTVKCTLHWNYHPSICYSDLFIISEDQNKHVCRTSQFYYDLECTVGCKFDLEILLCVHNYGSERFLDTSLKIPFNLISE